MSLDVYLRGPDREVECRCFDCGHEHIARSRETYYSGNITHNLTEMAMAASLYKVLWTPEQIVMGDPKASDLIDRLEAGLAWLKAHKSKARALAPANGWGTYEGLVAFVREYLEACKQHPDARVEVSR